MRKGRFCEEVIVPEDKESRATQPVTKRDRDISKEQSLVQAVNSEYLL